MAIGLALGTKSGAAAGGAGTAPSGASKAPERAIMTRANLRIISMLALRYRWERHGTAVRSEASIRPGFRSPHGSGLP